MYPKYADVDGDAMTISHSFGLAAQFSDYDEKKNELTMKPVVVEQKGTYEVTVHLIDANGAGTQATYSIIVDIQATNSTDDEGSDDLSQDVSD
jgi:hypothetical protein